MTIEEEFSAERARDKVGAWVIAWMFLSPAIWAVIAAAVYFW